MDYSLVWCTDMHKHPGLIYVRSAQSESPPEVRSVPRPPLTESQILSINIEKCSFPHFSMFPPVCLCYYSHLPRKTLLPLSCNVWHPLFGPYRLTELTESGRVLMLLVHYCVGHYWMLDLESWLGTHGDIISQFVFLWYLIWRTLILS